jgi:hypothetical protein
MVELFAVSRCNGVEKSVARTGAAIRELGFDPPTWIAGGRSFSELK